MDRRRVQQFHAHFENCVQRPHKNIITVFHLYLCDTWCVVECVDNVQPDQLLYLLLLFATR
jgi:hypothetical protein